MKDFKCRRCGAVLCKTNGKWIRVMLQGYVAQVSVRKYELTCLSCNAKNVWRQS